MSVHTKARTTTDLTEIRLVVPTRAATQVRQAIGGMLALVGKDAQLLVDDDEIDGNDGVVYSIEEVFPDASPGKCLRGIRTRDGITQKQLAEKLGIPQRQVADMENGTRKISAAMAKRIEKACNISHDVFL